MPVVPCSMDFDQPPVVRVSVAPEARPKPGTWPMDVPAVAQLVREGLDLSPFVTFLVGENGSGKSTLVEAIAAAYGLNPEGGTRDGQHATRASESPLGRLLTVQRGIGSSRWGFFLRAETMHGWYTFAEQHQHRHAGADRRGGRSDPVCHPLAGPRGDARRHDPGDRSMGLPAYDVGRAGARRALEGLPGRARTLPAARARLRSGTTCNATTSRGVKGV